MTNSHAHLVRTQLVLGNMLHMEFGIRLIPKLQDLRKKPQRFIYKI